MLQDDGHTLSRINMGNRVQHQNQAGMSCVDRLDVAAKQIRHRAELVARLDGIPECHRRLEEARARGRMVDLQVS